ncbi:SDR family NAD(P)-dependent oxidoreductase [Sporomusa acidovorans]|uniref:Gluconate 5-dehydrogenase n=1 Tax=Sporomusa acidovorans (strain ATCC 49682 / DSM 3132 / Mol) TaxID=1123286 RepID=A0ABZ3J584_SPOA4|nr:SDR family NAD(P)-dependent oxidoreductase [Sporomusa acidovorans]OZC15689.1 gluconate 5-dehydrogenase [Sporomusa acidovorans DSM 3132]SDE88973.1 short chain dehydrogenase [Sporomusa acidovorans]
MNQDNPFSLKGKTALITGASRGLGFAIACGLATAGATIAFNASKKISVEQGLAAYQTANITARGYVCDVTNETAVRDTITQIENEIGTIDILVNNAGIINRVPMVDMSTSDFRHIIDESMVTSYMSMADFSPIWENNPKHRSLTTEGKLKTGLTYFYSVNPVFFVYFLKL